MTEDFLGGSDSWGIAAILMELEERAKDSAALAINTCSIGYRSDRECMIYSHNKVLESCEDAFHLPDTSYLM